MVGEGDEVGEGDDVIDVVVVIVVGLAGWMTKLTLYFPGAG